MDEIFRLGGIEFVWDRDKALANPVKHDGVRFEQAAEVFFDPFVRVVDATRNEEPRDAVIGLDRRWMLLFVVHFLVEDDRVRIISARRATRAERAFYED